MNVNKVKKNNNTINAIKHDQTNRSIFFIAIAEKNREIQKLKAQAVDSAQRILTTTNAAIVFGNNIKLKEDQLTAVNEQLKKANEELAAAKKVESGRNQLIKQFEHKIAVFEKEKLSLTHQIENYKVI